MWKIVIFFILNIWTLGKADSTDIQFDFLRDENGDYKCISEQPIVVNENHMISMTVNVKDNVTANGCAADNNRSTVFINKLTEYNITTGLKKQGDIVPATLSMSTVWSCFMLLEPDEVYCNIVVHVISSRIPIIKINDEELSSQPPDDLTTDHDAEIEYEAGEGELIHISCIYNETVGMKFVYYGLGTNESATQQTDFIYDTTAIHDQVRFTNPKDAVYIECVVKRTEYQNAVVRVYLVSDEKTRNGKFLLLLELGFILCTAFLMAILLAIRAKYINKKLLSEGNASLCETIDDGLSSASTEQLENNVQFVTTERCEINTTTSKEPIHSSHPVSNSESDVYGNDNSNLLINTKLNNVQYKIYTNSGLNNAVRSEADNKYELNDNISNDKEILIDCNFDDNKRH